MKTYNGCSCTDVTSCSCFSKPKVASEISTDDTQEKPEAFDITIPLDIYRRHVVVAIGLGIGNLRELAKESNLHDLPESWWAVTEKTMAESSGFTSHFGDGNTDILVWLKKSPRDAEDYGPLYHELYHAVEITARQIDPACHMQDADGVSEARAYMYEYLATECLRVLWQRKARREEQDRFENHVLEMIESDPGVRPFAKKHPDGTMSVGAIINQP